MRKAFTVALAAITVLLMGVVAGVFLQGEPERSEEDERILSQLRASFQTIATNYVDAVDSTLLLDRGLEGLLSGLDPHSVYIPEERMERVEASFKGRFDGIGISYEMVPGPDGADTVAVQSLLPDGPSERAGLVSGDRILRIDGQNAIGMTHKQVRRALKGPKDSSVEIDLYRPYERSRKTVSIKRDRIPLHTVDVSRMLDSRTGYIRLNRFARTTYHEFTEALQALTSTGAERLVLDLRENSGGFMNMAVRVADEFLPSNRVIVKEESRHSDYNRAHRASSGGMFERGPVIVLVDDRSASASEIVAGALQDHDRALIVGSRTFGKGLVQQQLELDAGGALRLTVARYRTPSGRLIQTPYEGIDKLAYYNQRAKKNPSSAPIPVEEALDNPPDSVKYTTDQGRVVYGGGGILPDHLTTADQLLPLVKKLTKEEVFSSVARAVLDSPRSSLRQDWQGDWEAFLTDYTVPDELWQTLSDTLRKRGFIGEETSDTVGASTSDEKPGPVSDHRSFDSLAELNLHRSTLEAQLKAQLALRLFGQRAYHAARSGHDETVRQVRDLWPDSERLAASF